MVQSNHFRSCFFLVVCFVWVEGTRYETVVPERKKRLDSIHHKAGCMDHKEEREEVHLHVFIHYYFRDLD